MCVDNKYSKKIVSYRGKNAANVSIKSILNEYNYCKKIMRKYFNKNLVMSQKKMKDLKWLIFVGFVMG